MELESLHDRGSRRLDQSNLMTRNLELKIKLMNVVVRRTNYKFNSSFMYSRIQCACEKLKFLVLNIQKFCNHCGFQRKSTPTFVAVCYSVVSLT